MIRNLKLLAQLLWWLLVGGCAYTADYPTHLVLSGEFTADDRASILAAVAEWNAVGAHLTVSDGELRKVDTDAWVTPVYPAALPPSGHLDLLGLTSEAGMQIDVEHLHRAWSESDGVHKVALHEFGHVLGLGSPADGNQHVNVVGDVMCGEATCMMLGDGSLSVSDIEAWKSGGAR